MQQPWKKLQSWVEIVQKVLGDPQWTWLNNNRCKYICIKVDMRDGHAILLDRNNVRIDMDEFLRQWGVAQR